MKLFLSPEECKLPIDEIEALLIARDAPTDTILYQAHYKPAWLPESTISVLINQECSTISLYIWASPHQVDVAINPRRANPLLSPLTVSKLAQQPMLIEEHVELPRNTAFYFAHNMQKLNLVDLPSSPRGIGLDGLSVSADVLSLNQHKNHFTDWDPNDISHRYFWGLCYLAMQYMEAKRSLKYLITLTGWLIG